MNGTAVYGERVVIVEVHGGNVKLRTGKIASTPPGAARGDNPRETVVRGDRRFSPVTDDTDDAYEKSFQVGDVHLLKEEEARSLQDPGNVQTWFGSIYQDWVVKRIHHALKRFTPK